MVLKNKRLKDLAFDLGVSVTTVSKALNDYPDVSVATKKKIREHAQKLGFIPNSIAASLRTQESMILGIVVSNINNYFFSTVLQGLIMAAESAGYLVMVLSSEESYDKEKKHIDRLLHQKVDGIFISLAESTYEITHLETVMASETILIQFDKISKLVPSSKVIVDDRQAAFEATQHLILSGKKQIVHLRGPLLPQVSIDRFLGYKEALRKYKIPFEPKLVITCPKGHDSEGYHAMAELDEKGLAFDGVFAHADLVAVGAIRYLKEKKRIIPSEVAVVGFSNWLISSKITPSLSTIDQPGQRMGRTLFEQFQKQQKQKKEGATQTVQTHILPTTLIRRESS